MAYTKQTDDWKGFGRQLTGICDRNGVLDREKMVKSFVNWSQKIGFIG